MNWLCTENSMSKKHLQKFPKEVGKIKRKNKNERKQKK